MSKDRFTSIVIWTQYTNSCTDQVCHGFQIVLITQNRIKKLKRSLKKFKKDLIENCPEKAKELDIWYQDEARFCQRNTISRVWAIKGSRPGLIRQQQYDYVYVFGAGWPKLDKGIALVLPKANSECLALHCYEIAKETEEGPHAIVLMDNAGFHIAKTLPDTTIWALFIFLHTRQSSMQQKDPGSGWESMVYPIDALLATKTLFRLAQMPRINCAPKLAE